MKKVQGILITHGQFRPEKCLLTESPLNGEFATVRDVSVV
jgi:hypothetical protein